MSVNQMNALSLYLFFSGFAILSKYKIEKLYPFLKGLPVLYLMLELLNQSNYLSSVFAVFLLAGLFFSFCGDLFLLFPNKFKIGAVAFGTAHIFYSAGFLSAANFQVYPYLSIPFIAVGFIFYRLIAKFAKEEKMLVSFYILLIGTMGFSVFNYSLLLAPANFTVAAGVLLFLISDAVLAFGRYRKSFVGSNFIVLSTYYSAQLLLVSDFFPGV